jgi:hypothetical protein
MLLTPSPAFLPWSSTVIVNHLMLLEVDVIFSIAESAPVA